MTTVPQADAEVRLAALRAGAWLGWLSVAALLVALALGLAVEHRAAVLALVLAAAAGNALVVAVPRRWWTTAHRGERMLDAWSAGLLTLVALLVLLGGGRAGLDLLLFLVLPFLATVRREPWRSAWVAAGLASFVVVALVAPNPLPAGQVALRGCLLSAAALLAIVLADATRRVAAARAELQTKAALERALRAETHHRVKNSLQTVSDLLLLGRPDGEAGHRFDETTARIRAIAAVHRLLAEQGGTHLDAAELLELVVRGSAPDAALQADHVRLNATQAQHLGVVANELIANAAQHGAPPLTVELRDGSAVTLRVRDHGSGPDGAAPGLGLRLVRQVVEHGLGGSFALARDEPAGATVATVRFRVAATGGDTPTRPSAGGGADAGDRSAAGGADAGEADAQGAPS